MRKIKFRAWDKAQKRMTEYFGYGKGYMVGGEGIALNDLIHSEQNYFEFMQYTGLKDSKGVEIYDGDIVVKKGYIWFDSGEPNYRGIVTWIFSQWQVIARCVNPKKRAISEGVNEGFNDDGIDEGGRSDWEVIGNIYENKELLKCEK